MCGIVSFRTKAFQRAWLLPTQMGPFSLAVERLLALSLKLTLSSGLGTVT